MKNSKGKVGSKSSMSSRSGADARMTTAKSMMPMIGKKSGMSHDKQDAKNTRC